MERALPLVFRMRPCCRDDVRDIAGWAAWFVFVLCALHFGLTGGKAFFVALGFNKPSEALFNSAIDLQSGYAAIVSDVHLAAMPARVMASPRKCTECFLDSSLTSSLAAS